MAKELRITLGTKGDEIKFSGSWNGKELKRVIAHLPREYRIHMRKIRLDALDALKQEQAIEKDADKLIKQTAKQI